MELKSLTLSKFEIYAARNKLSELCGLSTLKNMEELYLGKICTIKGGNKFEHIEQLLTLPKIKLISIGTYWSDVEQKPIADMKVVEQLRGRGVEVKLEWSSKQ